LFISGLGFAATCRKTPFATGLLPAALLPVK
jgi:hypothetical protein